MYVCINVQDLKTGLHQGYGWVRMSSDQDVQRVLEYRRHTIEGYEVRRRRKKV